MTDLTRQDLEEIDKIISHYRELTDYIFEVHLPISLKIKRLIDDINQKDKE